MKRSLAAVSVLSLLFGACQTTSTGSGTSAATDTIKIGYVGPLTGDIPGLGADTLNAVKMAVDEVNTQGGINGKQVEIIAEDGRCESGDAVAAGQKLINVDHVVAIIGGICSSETLAVAPLADAAKVVMLSPASSSPKVTDAGDFVFRNYPSDALKGKALGNYFKQAGYTKIAIIGENTDFCQGIRDSVKANLAPGASVVFDESVDQGTKDFRTLMTRLKKTKFDVFLANGQSDATVAEMAKQMRGLGMKQQIIGTDTSDTVNLGKIAKDAVEGLKPLSVPSLSSDDPFTKAFTAKYGDAQFGIFFAALTYDATRIILQTMQTTGTDGEKIRDALYAMPPYKGAAATISFDKNGDVKGIPFAMKEFKGGVLEQSELVPID